MAGITNKFRFDEDALSRLANDIDKAGSFREGIDGNSLIEAQRKERAAVNKKIRDQEEARKRREAHDWVNWEGYPPDIMTGDEWDRVYGFAPNVNWPVGGLTISEHGRVYEYTGGMDPAAATTWREIDPETGRRIGGCRK